jgi:hypothetical protein
MALQSYGDYLIAQGFYQDPETGSWKRYDPSSGDVEHLDAQDTGSPLYQDWAQQRAATIAQAGTQPNLVQLDPFNNQSIQFQDPTTGQWLHNNGNTYDSVKDTEAFQKLAENYGVGQQDFGADAALGLAGNSITSQEYWAQQEQTGGMDKLGDAASMLPVVAAAAATGGLLAGPAAGGLSSLLGTTVTPAVAGGAISGSLYGGLQSGNPDLKGAAIGGLTGALGGAAKDFISPYLASSGIGEYISKLLPAGTPTDGVLELLSAQGVDPNAAGLAQMGVDAGLSGDALQAFIDGGGTAGSTAAGGGGAAGLLGGADSAATQPTVTPDGQVDVRQWASSLGGLNPDGSINWDAINNSLNQQGITGIDGSSYVAPGTSALGTSNTVPVQDWAKLLGTGGALAGAGGIPEGGRDTDVNSTGTTPSNNGGRDPDYSPTSTGLTGISKLLADAGLPADVAKLLGGLAPSLLGAGIGAAAGGSPSTQIQSTDIPEWLKPYYTKTLDAGITNLNNSQNLSAGENSTIANLVASLQQPNAGLNAANQTLTDTAAGKYLNIGTNPQWQDLSTQIGEKYNMFTRPATDQQFSRAGAFGVGNSAWEEFTGQNQADLARGLATGAANIYGNERNLQNQAATNMPTWQTQFLTQLPNAALTAQGYGRNVAQQGLSSMSGILGATRGPQTSSSSSQNSMLNNILGGALTGGALGRLWG